MPYYPYRCLVCGHETLVNRTVEHRDDEIVCPWHPNHPAQILMVRIPSSPSFHLKGAGFHVNDYPKKG